MFFASVLAPLDPRFVSRIDAEIQRQRDAGSPIVGVAVVAVLMSDPISPVADYETLDIVVWLRERGLGLCDGLPGAVQRLVAWHRMRGMMRPSDAQLRTDVVKANPGCTSVDALGAIAEYDALDKARRLQE